MNRELDRTGLAYRRGQQLDKPERERDLRQFAQPLRIRRAEVDGWHGSSNHLWKSPIVLFTGFGDLRPASARKT